ncbi:MAG: DJ-1/PfpI family protein [Spirochaetota bacterium]|nr:DJ-1/PfpI family protein [Spirochaetota bacterium]
MKTVLIPLAPGFEEIEALTVVDILRRADVNVITAGTVDGLIEGRSKIKVLADVSIEKVNPDIIDMIVLPGGQPGTNNLKNNQTVLNIVKTIYNKNCYTAAICAAPTVLSAIGILNNKKITSHQSVKKDLTMTQYSEDRVVVDGNIITSRSPGTAMEFAMKLLEILCGKETMEKVNQSVLAKL